MDKENIPNKTVETDFSKIFVALLVILVTIVIFVLYQRKKSSKRAILLTGLSNTGKTLLHARLVHKKYVDTYTSMKENLGDYVVNGTSLRIIDVPGHERLRDKFFDQYKTSARAIIYVIDSSAIQKEVRDIAEYLYNILGDTVVSHSGLNVLILCNKQDIPLSKSSKAVRSILEKELTTLQVTKLSQLESVDPKTKTSNSVLCEGDTFEFDLLSSVKVDFIDSNATNEKDGAANIEELERWLTKIA